MAAKSDAVTPKSSFRSANQRLSMDCRLNFLMNPQEFMELFCSAFVAAFRALLRLMSSSVIGDRYASVGVAMTAAKILRAHPQPVTDGGRHQCGDNVVRGGQGLVPFNLSLKGRSPCNFECVGVQDRSSEKSSRTEAGLSRCHPRLRGASG